MAAVRRHAYDRRGFDDAGVQAWTRILAAARLVEGFDGPYAEWLTTIARGPHPDRVERFRMLTIR